MKRARTPHAGGRPTITAPPGVYEDTDAFAGTNAFNVYRTDGLRIGRWEAVAGITDEELLTAFDKLLERTDPAPKLKLL